MEIVGLALIGIGVFLAGWRRVILNPFGPREFSPAAKRDLVIGVVLLAAGLSLLLTLA